MKTILILTGYFLAQCVDTDSNGIYNVLLEQLSGSKHKSHTLVAHWTKDPKEFRAGNIYHLVVKGDCTQTYDVREGNGKKGSAWAPEDDWYLNGKPYICNSIEVTHESNATLTPCDAYSPYCSICKD